uniref:Uncharacterized protein n=1 Tax=Panagrolaimus davidi TaxID=227884 RepID=A0A914PYB7_9BILA
MSDIAQYKVYEQILYPVQGNQMNQSMPRHSSGGLIDPLAIPKHVIVPTVRYIPASRKKPIGFSSSGLPSSPFGGEKIMVL